MGKARAIETGAGAAGVRLEYVRSRRVFRLGGWHRDGEAEIPPVEVPTGRFLAELGIEPAELGATPLYLLVAGVRGEPRGGIRHIVRAFPSELDARHQFRLLHGTHRQPDEWARLVTVDARCRVVSLCWFGQGAMEPGEEGRESPAPALRPRWPGRRRSRSG